MKEISLEMAEAYSKINRVIRSCRNLEQLGVALRMIEQFEFLFRKKQPCRKRWDLTGATELMYASNSLRASHLSKTEEFFRQ
jgi:hypothetical protein